LKSKILEQIDKKGYVSKSYRWIHEGEGYESLIDLSDDLTDDIDKELMKE
jgi:hypothetical protein